MKKLNFISMSFFFETVIIYELFFLLIGRFLLGKDAYSTFPLILNCLCVYLIACLFIRKVIFDENKILIIYPIRFWKRRLQIDYEKILEAKYISASKGPDSLTLKYSKRIFPFYIGIPRYIFPSEVIRLIELFKSKGVVIIVSPNLEKKTTQ